MRITERFSEKHIDVDNTPTLIRQGPTELCGLHVENNDEGAVFLLLYNAPTANDVIFGTTVPDKTFRIAAEGSLTLEATQVWLSTVQGLVAALSTDRQGAGTPTAATASFYTTRR